MAIETGKNKKQAPRGQVTILKSWCKGCGFCVEFCPRKVLALSKRYNAKGYHPPEVVNPDACTACDICMLMCPDFAIFIEKTEKKGGDEG